MRTRSRQEAGGSKPADEEAQAAPTPRSPRRPTKKRRAPETISAPPAPVSAARETNKAKGAASAAAVVTPPPKGAKAKGASIQEAKKKSTPLKASKGAGSRGGKAVEDQSLCPKGKDQESGAAITAGLGVAPKGRCVSGRDWKARNQSQRCEYAGCRGR